MNVGEKIKTARLAKGMTQEELGEILGVQKSAIAKYENGRVVNIKRSTLKKISDALGIPPHELIFDEKLMLENKAPSNEKDLSEAERMVLELVRMVPEDQQQLVIGMVRVALNTPKQSE